MAKESKYREDCDLIFLQNADWTELKMLADALIQDFDGNEQWTGGLKETLNKNKDLYPDSEEELFRNSWKAIVAEIQLFGGNTIANVFRQEGILYQEIVNDVAKKIGVDYQKGISVQELEEKILRNLFGNKIKSLSQLSEMNEILKGKGFLGFSSLLSQPVETIKNSLGINTSLAGGVTAGLGVLVKAMKMNPIITLASLPLGSVELAAPAYRVTIPVVCIIAILRKNYDGNQYNEF